MYMCLYLDVLLCIAHLLGLLVKQLRMNPSFTFHLPPPSLLPSPPPGTLSTVGVDVGIWRYRKDLEPDLRGKRRSLKAMKSVTFYTWDFGGQEEYYVTHQCFLSTRSLYLAVWDVEEGEAGIDGLGPWLHNIQVRCCRRNGWTIRGLSCTKCGRLCKNHVWMQCNLSPSIPPFFLSSFTPLSSPPSLPSLPSPLSSLLSPLPSPQARAPGSPVIIVGTHIDRLKGEDRERKKVEFSNIIKDKYLVSYSTTACTCATCNV